jgi:hypothetical protein
MKKAIIFSILCAGLMSSSLFAQSVDLASVNQVTSHNDMSPKSSLSPFGLIDLSKVKWSNSYSISYFSGGNSSMSMGVLNTQFGYEFSSKLSMTLNFGLAHNTKAMANGENADATVLPGFSLDFHPSEKFRMNLSYQTYRNGMGSNGMVNYYDWWRRDTFYR